MIKEKITHNGEIWGACIPKGLCKAVLNKMEDDDIYEKSTLLRYLLIQYAKGKFKNVCKTKEFADASRLQSNRKL